MDILSRAVHHIVETAKVPSFSSYEERLQPYVQEVFRSISNYTTYAVGNNLIYEIPGTGSKTIALTAHIDKINHYGEALIEKLPVKLTSKFIEGAMDDSAGLGSILAIAELAGRRKLPNLLFFFSEMEESKGLKEHPELLKNNGEGYRTGMGAERISKKCLKLELIPDEIITIDTTPLFKGEPGIALYSKHWELNELEQSTELVRQTESLVGSLTSIDPAIQLNNNTNDYLEYGKLFNESGEYTVPSIALEPSIFPYHQKGERVFISDIKRVLSILTQYFERQTN